MKVSVIVPVYNVAKYIKSAVLSLISQTYDDLEIIFVDDFGLDDSISTLKKLLVNNGRQHCCKILRHKYNRGLSAARNSGLLEANGDYVYFFDSDDILISTSIETLVSMADANLDAEIIVGQYDEFYEYSDLHSSRWKQISGVYAVDVIGAYLDGKIPVTAWNKLIKRNFLIDNKLLFAEGLIHEDLLWSFQTFCKAKKVVVSDQITYHYRQRQNSLDKQNGLEFHSRHFNMVYNLQSQFVFELGLQKDKRFYNYIEKNRYQLLTNASMFNRTFGYELYKETLKYPYWKQIHRFFPKMIGYIIYIRVRCIWLIIKKLNLI